MVLPYAMSAWLYAVTLSSVYSACVLSALLKPPASFAHMPAIS